MPHDSFMLTFGDKKMEVQNNRARVIVDGNPGAWHQFDTSRVNEASADVISHKQVTIRYGNKVIRALISGDAIKYDKGDAAIAVALWVNR